jgi:hypothetical protein
LHVLELILNEFYDEYSGDEKHEESIVVDSEVADLVVDWSYYYQRKRK